MQIYPLMVIQLKSTPGGAVSPGSTAPLPAPEQMLLRECGPIGFFTKISCYAVFDCEWSNETRYWKKDEKY